MLLVDVNCIPYLHACPHTMGHGQVAIPCCTTCTGSGATDPVFVAIYSYQYGLHVEKYDIDNQVYIVYYLHLIIQ